MPKGSLVTNLQTFGMEIEAAIPINNGGNFSLPDFGATHDASIETPVTLINNTGLNFNSSDGLEKLKRLVPTSSYTAGVELVSSVLDMENPEEVKKTVERAFEKLLELGESPWGDERCGIHYHISLSSPNVRFLKYIVKIWSYLEDITYTLAGMGSVFRGQENNACYARPLLGNGIFVPYNYGWAQAIELPKVFNSSNVSEFFEAWGDSTVQSRGRYFPVRYYGLNLAAILYKGTVEFRPLNTNLNWHWNWAMLNYFQKMLEYATISSLQKTKQFPELEPHSIYEPRTKEKMLEGLADFWRLSEAESNIFYILEIILNCTDIPRIDSRPIRTHLSRRGGINNHWAESRYKPGITLSGDNVSLPKFTDIHILRGE